MKISMKHMRKQTNYFRKQINYEIFSSCSPDCWHLLRFDSSVLNYIDGIQTIDQIFMEMCTNVSIQFFLSGFLSVCLHFF